MKQGWILAEPRTDAATTLWQYRLFGPEGEIAIAENTGCDSRDGADAATAADRLLLAELAARLDGHGPAQVLVLGHPQAELRPLPSTPLPTNTASLAQDRSDLLLWHVLPQLSQTAPPELSQGAECLLGGALAIAPKFDGVIVVRRRSSALWAHVSAGEVISLQSLLTRPLRQALAPGVLDLARHAELFDTALTETLSRPERLAARLGSLAARQRLEGLDPSACASLAQGWLLGAELAATRPFWLGQAVLIVEAEAGAGQPADDGLARALQAQGITPHRLPQASALLAALRQLLPLR